MNNRKKYLISIDGGGTKTGICVYDCESEISHYGICGGGNYKIHGIDTVKERISECLDQLIGDCGTIPDKTRFLVLGLSGCDSPKDEQIYADMITSLGFDRKSILICNDSEMIFRSLTDEPGVCVIAGTGTIALSFESDSTVQRAGGWGAPLSDEGSGYWIGAELLRRYLNWIDGTGSYHEIFAELQKPYPNWEKEEIAAEFGALQTDQVAQWAKTIGENVEQDSLCKEIILSAGKKTAGLALSVYRKSGLSRENKLVIVESGSLFKNQLYEKSFQDTLRDSLSSAVIKFIRSEEIPAKEGIRLARKMAENLVVTQSDD